jgi:hypothetical protein
MNGERNMKKNRYISLVFYLSACYDGLLGLAFLFFAEGLYLFFGVTPPNHYGYVQFPALILIVFAVMFFQIGRDPRTNFNLIPYGILLKVSYCAVVFWYWISSPLPSMWKPFAVLDVVFGILFLWSYASIRKEIRGQ